MKSLIVVTVLLLSLVKAQTTSIQGLPSCAQECIVGNEGAAGCSDPNDVACFCASTAYITDVSSCIVTSCSTSDQQTALQALSSLCATSGVTTSFTVAATASVASSALASVASSALASVASGVLSDISSAASSAASSALVSSVVSSLASAATSVASSAASSITSSDATTLSTRTTTSTSSRSSTSGVAQSSSASITSDNSSKGSGSGKYIGIGVGVGVTCVVIFGGLLAWLMWRRHKSSKTGIQSHASEHRSGDGGDKMAVTTVTTSASSDSEPIANYGYKHELPVQAQQVQDRSQDPQDLEAMQRRIGELEAQQRANELEAARQRVQELEQQQRTYETQAQRHAQELEARQRYEMEHSRDRYAMLPSEEYPVPEKFRNAREPLELQ